MALLSVRGVTLRFGGIVALDGVSFDVELGQIAGLIGPNGAGKTTAFNVITRLYKPDEGELELDGESLLRTPPHRIVGRGIARTFQNINLFRTMSVLENVLLGAHARGRGVGERGGAAQMLDYVGLAIGRAHARAAALPYGTQKRVELARALIAQPKLLLLDEPAGGLNHEEVAQLGSFIRADPRGPRPDGAPRRAPHEPRHGDLRPRHACSTSAARSPPARPAEVRAEPGSDRGVPRAPRRGRGAERAARAARACRRTTGRCRRSATSR